MKMKDVLYVPGFKNNILSISSLDEKGFLVSFIDGEVLVWLRGKSIDDVVVIGVQEGGLYKLKGHSNSELVHNIVTPSELHNRIFYHIHYKSLPIVRKMVMGFPEIQVNHEVIFKGCTQGKYKKKPIAKPKDPWISYIHMCVDQCQPLHLADMYIMFHSLMISHVKLGFTF
jgi:hypothetical protein